CTTIPLASGEGSGGRNHSVSIGFSKPWSCAVRPPGSAGTDQAPGDGAKGAASYSGVLEDSCLHQNASRRILPERNQQLARRRDGRPCASSARGTTQPALTAADAAAIARRSGS